MFRLQKQHIDIRLLLRLTLPIFLELVLAASRGQRGQNHGRQRLQRHGHQSGQHHSRHAGRQPVRALSRRPSFLISQYKGAHNKGKGTAGLCAFLLLQSDRQPLHRPCCLAVLARPVLFRHSTFSSAKSWTKRSSICCITGSGLFLQAVMLSLSAYLRSNTYMKQCPFRGLSLQHHQHQRQRSLSSGDSACRAPWPSPFPP